jgi:hypothetical protein
MPMKLINNKEIVFFHELCPFGATQLRGEDFRWADLAQVT